jgi:hypothetical protein
MDRFQHILSRSRHARSESQKASDVKAAARLREATDRSDDKPVASKAPVPALPHPDRPSKD